MRKIEIIFEKMLPIITEALSDQIDNKGNIPKIGRNPKFSDVKVITLALAAEFLSIDSENRLFSFIKNSAFFSLNGLIERSAFNRRRKSLCELNGFGFVKKTLTQHLIMDIVLLRKIPISVISFMGNAVLVVSSKRLI